MGSRPIIAIPFADDRMARIFPQTLLESMKARVKDEDADESENFAPRQIDLSRNPIAASCMFPAFFSFSTFSSSSPPCRETR